MNRSCLVFALVACLFAPAIAGEPGWIGIRACERRRLIVQEVFHGTPAEEAGMRAGDEILTIEWEAGVEDIQDEILGLGAGNPVRVRMARQGSIEEISVMLAPRPLESIPKGSTVYVPVSSRVAVKPGDPLAFFECRDNCYAGVPECDPLVLDAQGPERIIGHWKGHLVSFTKDLRGRTYLDKTACERDAKTKCGLVL